ncbi:hypothetical protein AUJ10_02745 [Candidatus Pacearchaeota archaeon CG1_02_31_27]|nr:MAG: hypothetical protein AUJ10_02745 [Candidatus Pacearchaeota archaeon CG1_02_31_27]PIN92108.1 MAG: hypothetical protein COU55_02895 [Candidatus Pacearchaeota archaeon CG10_big_fil_rev_8_21_14_0_10_31_59]PIZ80323.1 MAG: hypothetical protein COX99_03000 [Candidatus Pacearchaeota archaeon CG_4_10_14_0_2_um_filter_31_10]
MKKSVLAVFVVILLLSLTIVYAEEISSLSHTWKEGKSSDSIYIQTFSGASKEYNIIFKADENAEYQVFSGIPFVTVTPNKFTLNKGDTKTINLKIASPEAPAIYFGNIVIWKGAKRSEIPIEISVDSKDLVLNVQAMMSQKYKAVEAGSEAEGTIIINYIKEGPPENVLVDVIYYVEDKNGNLYWSGSDRLSTDKTVELTKKFRSPTSPGNYNFVAEIYFLNYALKSKDSFVVSGGALPIEFLRIVSSYFLIGLFIAILVAITIIFFVIRNKKFTSVSKVRNLVKRGSSSGNKKQAAAFYKKAVEEMNKLPAEKRKEVYNEVMGLYKKVK